MVTIREIAEYCGVSTATVSKALNHGTDISKATALRIRTAAQNLGYYPNSAALSLKTRHSHNIGLLTQLRDQNGLLHDFVTLVINSFQATAEQNGYDVTFVSENIRGNTMTYLEHCRYRNFDGVALICADFLSDSVREFMTSNIPTVTVDCYDTKHYSVMTNNQEAYATLLDHVMALGHRRIAFVGGRDSAIADLRFDCFMQVCRSRGLSVPKEYIHSAFYNDLVSTAEATRQLVKLPTPPTCIFYPDDFACMGGMQELYQQGFSVPKDMSIVGFDGIRLSQILQPRLTTYRQNMDAIGQRAMQILRDAIEQPGITLPQKHYIPGELITGETVARI